MCVTCYYALLLMKTYNSCKLWDSTYKVSKTCLVKHTCFRRDDFTHIPCVVSMWLTSLAMIDPVAHSSGNPHSIPTIGSYYYSFQFLEISKQNSGLIIIIRKPLAKQKNVRSPSRFAEQLSLKSYLRQE